VEDYYCVVVNADSDSNNMNNNQTECWRDLVMGNGIQYCPYSTSVLGNPQKRHAQDNTSSSNNSNGDWSPLKTALFQTIQKQLLLSNSDDNDILSANQENEERKNYWRQQVQNLDTKILKIGFLDH